MTVSFRENIRLKELLVVQRQEMTKSHKKLSNFISQYSRYSPTQSIVQTTPSPNWLLRPTAGRKTKIQNSTLNASNVQRHLRLLNMESCNSATGEGG